MLLPAVGSGAGCSPSDKIQHQPRFLNPLPQPLPLRRRRRGILRVSHSPEGVYFWLNGGHRSISSGLVAASDKQEDWESVISTNMAPRTDDNCLAPNGEVTVSFFFFFFSNDTVVL